MEENFDKSSSSQQHTTGSGETLEQTFTEEKETEPTTPTTTPLSIDEQETKISPQKKVLSETSKQCLPDESNNISSPHSMDDEPILQVTTTPSENKEIVSKPEENWNYSFKTALKTEFFENTPTSENPINDTKEDQTLKYDFANTDQTSKTQKKNLNEEICEIPQTSEQFLAPNESHEKLNTTQKSDCLIDIDSTNQNAVHTDMLATQVNQIWSELIVESSQNRENSFEADDSQEKLHYSEINNFLENIQGIFNSKSQLESKKLNFSSEKLESENESSALSEGKEILKATCDSYVPSAHDCKRNQTKPNFDCKLSQKIKKPSLEKEKNICIVKPVKRLNSNSDCTESKKKNLNVSKQTSSHLKSHNYALPLPPIEFFFRNISKGAEKTADTNKVLPKISQAGIIPESKDSTNKSIETRQITESSKLSSASQCNNEMGDNFGNTYLKVNFDMPPTPSPELPYFSEKSRESDDLTSRESKSSEDSQTKGVYTPSRESTESIRIRENSCGLNLSVKSQNITEEHQYATRLISPESPEPETSCTSVSKLDEQGKSDESIKYGENTIQNSSSTEISSKQSELQVKSDEVSRESVSDDISNSETFSPDMVAVITDVIDRIVRISVTFDSQIEHWGNTNPGLEINIPENIEEEAIDIHIDIVETFNSIHSSLIRIADAANSSVEDMLDSIRALRPHVDVLGLVRGTVNTMEHFLKDLRDVADLVSDLDPLTENTPYRPYYLEFYNSVVSIYRALNGIIQHLQRIGILYRNEQAVAKKPKT